jgi:hypothetical protein
MTDDEEKRIEPPDIPIPPDPPKPTKKDKPRGKRRMAATVRNGKTSKRITAAMVQKTENLPAPVPNVPVTIEPDDDELELGQMLTLRQRLFVEAYIGPAALNGSKAAQMAGYRSENVYGLSLAAQRLLNNPIVQEAIAAGIARKRMSIDWCQDRLVLLASSSMTNFVTIDEQGRIKIDWLRAQQYAAIGQIAEIQEDAVGIGEDREVIRTRFKLHSPVKALEALIRLQAALPEPRKEFFDVTKLSDEELEILGALHAKATGSGPGPAAGSSAIIRARGMESRTGGIEEAPHDSQDTRRHGGDDIQGEMDSGETSGFVG